MKLILTILALSSFSLFASVSEVATYVKSHVNDVDHTETYIDVAILSGEEAEFSAAIAEAVSNFEGLEDLSVLSIYRDFKGQVDATTLDKAVNAAFDAWGNPFFCELLVSENETGIDPYSKEGQLECQSIFSKIVEKFAYDKDLVSVKVVILSGNNWGIEKRVLLYGTDGEKAVTALFDLVHEI